MTDIHLFEIGPIVMELVITSQPIRLCACGSVIAYVCVCIHKTTLHEIDMRHCSLLCVHFTLMSHDVCRLTAAAQSDQLSVTKNFTQTRNRQ